MAIEKIKHLDEGRARQLLTWLEQLECTATAHRKPAGAMAMLGFARRFRPEGRATAEWMDELRGGEHD